MYNLITGHIYRSFNHPASLSIHNVSLFWIITQEWVLLVSLKLHLFWLANIAEQFTQINIFLFVFNVGFSLKSAIAMLGLLLLCR